MVTRQRGPFVCVCAKERSHCRNAWSRQGADGVGLSRNSTLKCCLVRSSTKASVLSVTCSDLLIPMSVEGIPVVRDPGQRDAGSDLLGLVEIRLSSSTIFHLRGVNSKSPNRFAPSRRSSPSDGCFLRSLRRVVPADRTARLQPSPDRLSAGTQVFVKQEWRLFHSEIGQQLRMQLIRHHQVVADRTIIRDGLAGLAGVTSIVATEAPC
jgi:hypothetical protein